VLRYDTSDIKKKFSKTPLLLYPKLKSFVTELGSRADVSTPFEPTEAVVDEGDKLIRRGTNPVLKTTTLTKAPITLYLVYRLLIAEKPGGYGVPVLVSGSKRLLILKLANDVLPIALE